MVSVGNRASASRPTAGADDRSRARAAPGVLPGPVAVPTCHVDIHGAKGGGVQGRLARDVGRLREPAARDRVDAVAAHCHAAAAVKLARGWPCHVAVAVAEREAADEQRGAACAR